MSKEISKVEVEEIKIEEVKVKEVKVEEVKVEERPSLHEKIQDKLQNQDFIQKSTSVVLFCLELYRVIVSTLLILTVPQECGSGEVCSYQENLYSENHLYMAGLIFNFITMSSFFLMYFVEIHREYKLIHYLEVNHSKPFDNESVAQALTALANHRRENILKIDAYYYRLAMVSLFLFLCNTILSGFVIYDYYLDNQTTTTYVTNILFMITKLYDVYSTVSTPKNIFYSAYLKTKVQYNDVDPHKCESVRSMDIEMMAPMVDEKEESEKKVSIIHV